jgi:hypothetical protein
MYARLLLVCFVVGCSQKSGADADIKKTAKAQAEEIQSGLIKGDFEKVADRTHPKAVKALGGREKMLTTLRDGMKEMKEDGFEFKAVKMHEPSDPVKVGQDIYIVVPFNLEMSAKGQRLQTAGALLGVSSDGGKTWVFVDTAPGRENIKGMFPDMPDSLVIPKQEMPTLVKD